MDPNPKPTAKDEKLTGLIVCGVVMSSTATCINRKDGSGRFVCVRHEIALQPGVAILEEYPDLNDAKIKLDGSTVVEFPRLPEFKPVKLKVLRWAERDKRLVIKEAQVIT